MIVWILRVLTFWTPDHKLPSHLKTSPPLFHPLKGLFPPKYDIFTHFEKESSSDSAKNQVSSLETVPWRYMGDTIRCLAIWILLHPFSTPSEVVPSHIDTSPPLFHPISTKIWHFHSFWKGIKLWFSQEHSISLGNCPKMIYGGYHKLLSHLKPSPTVFHPLRGIFPPKYDIFTNFEKESSSDSA